MRSFAMGVAQPFAIHHKTKKPGKYRAWGVPHSYAAPSEPHVNSRANLHDPPILRKTAPPGQKAVHNMTHYRASPSCNQPRRVRGRDRLRSLVARATSPSV